MATSDNILQQVITYNKAGLALLQNSYCFYSTANKKYNNFQDKPANLGDTVSFDLPPRLISNSSLVAVFQGVEQRKVELTVSEAENCAYSFTNQQFLFNVEEYMGEIGTSATAELGDKVEANVATVCETTPYRFYGNGVAAIDSHGDLAAALALFRNYGAAKTMTKGYLSDIAVPPIVASGLSEFATNRNNKEAMSWELGDFSRCEWYESNLLPQHISGTVGVGAKTLVVTAVTTDADGGISQLICSGAGADVDAVKEHDSLEFQDGVAGEIDIRFRTFIGHNPSANHVQLRVTADSTSVADSVTIDITPKLYVAAGRNQNITTAVSPGMELLALPSHRCGLITAGDPLFIANPQLPQETPFPTSNEIDKETGASLRQYYGSKFGLNERGMVHDTIWGKKLIAEYSMKLVFPL